MAIRRDVVLAVGGFPNGIGRVGTRPVGCEETDLCIRVHAQRPGTRIVHEPRARIGHWVPEDRATPSYFLQRCYAEGLSKALVAERSGQGAALATERAYVRRVLPAGVLRGLADVARRRAGGAGRAAAIVGGLTVTAAGYARARAELRLRRGTGQDVDGGLAVADAELADRRRGVAADGHGRDAQAPRDLPRGQALAQGLEDLPLALAEGDGERGTHARAAAQPGDAQLVEQPRDEAAGDRGLAGEDAQQRLPERLRLDVLGQVAHRAGADGREQLAVVEAAGQQHGARGG
jgi:hypothetical protein